MGKTPSLEELVEYFQLPFQEAAIALGVCQTSLKKLCRKYGIIRWPQRKLKGVERKLESLKKSLDEFPDKDKAALQNQILRLEHTRSEICNVRPVAGSCERASRQDAHAPIIAFPAHRGMQGSWNPSPNQSHARQQSSFPPQFAPPPLYPRTPNQALPFPCQPVQPMFSAEQPVYPFPLQSAGSFGSFGNSESAIPRHPLATRSLSEAELYHHPESPRDQPLFMKQKSEMDLTYAGPGPRISRIVPRPRISMEHLCPSSISSSSSAPSSALLSSNTTPLWGNMPTSNATTPVIKDLNEKLAGWAGVACSPIVQSPGPNPDSRHLPEPNWKAVSPVAASRGWL